jgi:TolA-binding protein
MCEIIAAGHKKEVQLQSKSQPDFSTSNAFNRAVLEIIADLSPCSEPKLFMTAITRGLTRASEESLGDFRARLGRCVEHLQARGVVAREGDELALASTADAENLTAELEFAKEDVSTLREELQSLQTQAQEPERPREDPKANEPQEHEDLLDLAGEIEFLEDAATPQEQASLSDNEPETPREGAVALETAEDVDILDLTEALAPDAPEDASNDEEHAEDDVHANPTRGTEREDMIARMTQFFLDHEPDGGRRKGY